jgi:RNA polymerase sigma-70 factor, ECF subfamily
VSGVDTTQLVERERGRLFGIAYRLLGSVADAEDAVQETFLRWEQSERAAIDNPPGWLTTVLTRHCIDQIRSARARREQRSTPWMPEPLLQQEADEVDPAERVTLDESVSLAMLVVLETLSPAERAVFVLHDVFGMEFEELGATVGRTPAACRQLASRARRHVEERRPRFDADAAQQRRVVAAFLDAAGRGDLEALLPLLDPSVVLRSEGGGALPVAGRPVHGAAKVAKVLTGGLRFFPTLVRRPVTLNGGTGVLISLDGELVAAVGVTVAGGVITEIDVVANPAKLRRLPA